MKDKDVRVFRRAVWAYYTKHKRGELLWRKTHDPYKILVSEVMLQQTQVPRVIGKYKEFLIAFPTIYLLAQASLSEVLKVWSGLGYNRRAKYLHDAARAIVTEYRGDVEVATLAKKLPGVGPYTKAAVRVFAFNEPHALIETNVRAAYIHHFYSSVLQKTAIPDKELMPIIEKAAEGQDPRDWHWALMDYGSYIKKTHKNPARRSASHVRQSKFEGSLRQVRGAILRALHEGASIKKLPYEQARLKTALASLQKDGLIAKAGKGWRIA
ncbi:MAG: A/G-specific adenine glycosylase [Parcubacteria group bacterium Athens0416_74]|nr:MAG: A/G-specific adenine glycosylase [Parcubacteria group bacterium Athens0416_74]